MGEEGLNKIAKDFKEYVEAASALEEENRQLQRSINEMTEQAKVMRARFCEAKTEWRKQALNYTEKREIKLRDDFNEALFELYRTKQELAIYKTYYEEKAKGAPSMLDFNSIDKHVAIVNHSTEPLELCGHTVCFSNKYRYTFSAKSGVLKHGESLSLWWGAENKRMASDNSADKSFHYAVDPLISEGGLTLMKDGKVVASIRDTMELTSESCAGQVSTIITGRKRTKDHMDGVDENIANKMRRGGNDADDARKKIPTASSSPGKWEQTKELYGGFAFHNLRKGPSLRILEVEISNRQVKVSFDNRSSLPVSIDGRWKFWLLSPSQAPISCSCEALTVPDTAHSKMTMSLPREAAWRRFTHAVLRDPQDCARTACSGEVMRHTIEEQGRGDRPTEGSCVIS